MAPIDIDQTLNTIAKRASERARDSKPLDNDLLVLLSVQAYLQAVNEFIRKGVDPSIAQEVTKELLSRPISITESVQILSSTVIQYKKEAQ